MKDINKRVKAVLQDVVFEVLKKDWKKALEAVHDLASMVKSARMTKKQFTLIMENLETEMRARSNGDPAILDEWHRVLRNKDHYMKGGQIYLP